MVATASLDESVQVWQSSGAGKWRMLQRFVEFRQKVWSLAFSPDNRMLAAGTSDGMIRLFDIQEKQQLASWRAHRGGNVNALVFSPDGKWLISGGTMEVFVPGTGQRNSKMQLVRQEKSYLLPSHLMETNCDWNKATSNPVI